jgi:glycine/D-amino acid oxidase-like deaminating enzyme
VSVETADVVVIGGGVNGASIAYALAARGVKRVVLLEQGALAHGASGRSSALVRMHYTNEWDARLAGELSCVPALERADGGPPVFTHTGFVNVVAPPYAEALRKNVEMLRGIGINTVAVTPAELRDLQPFANVEDLGAAAYEPDRLREPGDVVEGSPRARAS